MSTPTLAVRMTADGSAVVVAAKQAETALQGVDKQASKTGGALQGTARSSEGLEAALRGMGGAGQAAAGFLGQMGSNASTATKLLGVLAGAAAAVGLQQMFSSALQEQEKYQRNMLRTEALLKSNGHAAGLTSAALRENAQSLALATLQSVEGVEQAQQILLTFGNVTGSTFLRATEAAANLATVTGGSLNSSMTMLGKALNDPVAGITAMARAGVSFSESQKVTIEGLVESNQLLEAQTLILDELSRQYGGVAKAEAGGYAGALDTLGQRVQELKVGMADYLDIGNRSSVVVNALAANVDGLTKSLKENEGAVTVALGALAGAASIAAVMGMSAALGGMASAIVLVKTAFVGLTAVMMANPFGLLAIGIGAAAGALIAYNRAQAETVPGMQRAIMDLESANNGLLNLKGQAGMTAAERAGYDARIDKIKELKGALDAIKASAGAAITGSVGSGDTALLRAERAASDARARAAASFWAQNQTGAQKMAAELRAARKAMGELFTLQVKAAIKAKYATATAGAKGLKDAEKALSEEQKRSAQVVALRNKLVEEAFDEQQKLIKAAKAADAALTAQYTSAATSAVTRLQDLRDEADAMAYAELNQVSMAVAVEQTTIARLKEKQVAAMGNEAVVLALQAEIDARKKIVGLIASNDAKAATKKAADSINQSLTDALMRGFEDGKGFAENLKTTLVNMFKTMVLRPVISAIVNPVAGALTGALGVSGAANAASSAASASSATGLIGQIGMLSGAFGTGMAAGFSSMMAAGVSGWATAAGSLIGTGAMSGIAAGLGMIAGPVAAVVLALSLLSKKTPGEQHMGGFASTAGRTGFDAAAAITLSRQGETRDLIDRNSPELQTAVASGAQAVVGSLTALAGTLGQKMTLALDLGFASNANGKAGNKNAFGYFGVTGENGQMLETYQNRELGEDAAKAFDQLLKDAADAMAKQILIGNENLMRAGETASGTLTRLSTSLTAVNGVLDTLNVSLLETSLAGGDAASKLIDAFGGGDAFANATSSYFQAFYSEAERSEIVTRQLTTALAGMGLELPSSIGAYRQLAEAQDLTTDSGRTAYAALLTLSGAFAEVTKAAGDASQQTSIRLGLERKLLELQGDTAAIRLLEIAGMDAANVALFDRVQALRLERDAADEAAAAARALAATNQALQDQIDVLTGAQTERSQALRDAADDSTRSLMRQVFALEDAKQAQEKYSAALGSAHTAYKAAQDAVRSAFDAVQSVQARATSNYVSAQDAVASAQDRITQALRSQNDAARSAAQAMQDLGQSLRDFVQGEVSSASQTFSTLLGRALAGDREAMQALPSSASAAADAARLGANSSAEARVAQARILADVMRVAQLASSTAMPEPLSEVDQLLAAQADLLAAQARLATAMEVANAIGAPLVQQQTDLIAEFQAAQAALIAAQASEAETFRLLREISGNTLATETAVNSLDLSIDQMKLTAQLSVSATVDTIVNAQIPQTLKDLALGVAGAIEKTVNVLVGDPAIPESLLRLGLLATDGVSLTLRALITDSGLTSNLRDIGLGQVDAVSKQINAIVTGTLPNDIKALALENSAAISKAISLTTTFAQTLTAEQRAALLEQGTTVFKTISAAVSGGTMTTDQRALLFEQGGALSKTVNALATGVLSADQRAVLNAVTGTTQISASVSLENKLAVDGGMLAYSKADVAAAYASGGLTIAGWLQASYGLQNTIAFEAREIALRLKSISTTGAMIVRSENRGSGLATFAAGGAFTNGIVSRPTEFPMGLMGEAGPEAIMPLTNINGSLGVRVAGSGNNNAELIAEIQSLRAEVQGLRAEARATAVNTGRSQDLLKRVTRNGEAMQTEAMA